MPFHYIVPSPSTALVCLFEFSQHILSLTLLQIRIILEEQTLPGEAKPFRMARDVYKSCMDVGKIEELGLQPIKNILNELGGWPVLLGPNTTWDGSDSYIWVQSMSLLKSKWL